MFEIKFNFVVFLKIAFFKLTNIYQTNLNWDVNAITLNFYSLFIYVINKRYVLPLITFAR